MPAKLLELLNNPNCIEWQHDYTTNLWMVAIKKEGKVKVICGVGEFTMSYTVKL